MIDDFSSAPERMTSSAIADTHCVLAQQARLATPPAAPWPSQQSPMLRYLVANTEGADAALVWLATHAWFEGGLDAINRALTHTGWSPKPANWGASPARACNTDH